MVSFSLQASPALWASLVSSSTVGVYWFLQWKYSKRTLHEPQRLHTKILNAATGLAVALPYLIVRDVPAFNMRLFPSTFATDAISVLLSVSGALFMIWARRTLADNWLDCTCIR